MHEIIERLFLGNLVDATDRQLLSKHNVLGIVTCCTPLELPEACRFNDIEYFSIDVEDVGHEDIGDYFVEAAQFIDSYLRRGAAVLVHCRSGVSRSATVTIAYLLLKKGFYLEEAFFHVRAKRVIVCPNIGFMGQLCSLECDVELHRIQSADTAQPQNSTSLASAEETHCLNDTNGFSGLGNSRTTNPIAATAASTDTVESSSNIGLLSSLANDHSHIMSTATNRSDLVRSHFTPDSENTHSRNNRCYPYLRPVFSHPAILEQVDRNAAVPGPASAMNQANHRASSFQILLNVKTNDAANKRPDVQDGLTTASDGEDCLNSLQQGGWTRPRSGSVRSGSEKLSRAQGKSQILSSCSAHIASQSSVSLTGKKTSENHQPKGGPLLPNRQRRILPSICMDKYIDWYIADANTRATVPDLEP